MIFQTVGIVPVYAVENAADSNAQELSKESIAKVQALINALPTLEELQAVTDKAEQNKIYTDLQTAYDAYQSLTKEEQAEVTGAEVFEALFNYFNTMTETLAKGDGNIVLTELSGALTFTSTGYKLGSTEYTYSGNYTLSGTTNKVITFADNAGTCNVTMNNLMVNVGETKCAIDLYDNVTANITLTGDNSITGYTIVGVNNTTIFTVTEASTGSLAMVADYKGGTLTGDWDFNLMGIVNLNGGTITVTNHNASGNAIGISTIKGTVNINGANVTAVGSSSTKYAIANNAKNTIGGNSIVRASSPAGGVGGEGSRTDCIVYNSTDKTNYVGTVYGTVALDTLDVEATDTLLIPAGTSLTVNGAITDNGKIHVMGTLTAGSIAKGAGAKLYQYDGGTITIPGAAIDAAEAAKLDITKGSITIEEDGYTQGSGSKQLHYGSYEITGKSPGGNWITIKSGSPSITLNDVEIGNFSVPSDSSASLVSLTLSGTNRMNISDIIYSSIKINGAGTLSVNGSMRFDGGKSFTLDQATVAISGQLYISRQGSSFNVNSGKLYVGMNIYSYSNININGGTVFVGENIDGGFTLDGDGVLYANTIVGTPVYTKGIVYTGCTISNMSVNGATIIGGTGKIYGNPNVSNFINPTGSSLGCALTADNIGAIPDVAYTGTTALPNPTVKVNRIALGGEKTLVQGTDYTVAVTSANKANVGKATATITGTGGFSGTFTKDFNIVKSGSTVNAPTISKENITYGDSFMVSFTPKVLTQKNFFARTFSRASTTTKTAELYFGNTLLATQTNVTENTAVTFNVTADKKIPATAFDGTAQTFTIQWGGDDSLNASQGAVTATLNKKAITSATVTAGATKVYDGTNSLIGVALENLQALESGDTVTATADGAVADANVDATKAFTATSVTLAGAQAGYYSLAADKVSGNAAITKASLTGVSQEYPVVKTLAKDYSFDLSKLLPSIAPTQEYGNVTYAVASTGNANSVLTAVPTNSDIAKGKLTLKVASVAEKDQTATVTISITTDNFTVTNAVITVKTVDKIPLTISCVAMMERVYNGSAYAYTGTPTFTNTTDHKAVTGVSFTKEYEGRNTTVYTTSETAPTNAGEYNLILTVSGASAETYAGTLTVPFAITQKEVTVKAKDRDILVGAEIPSLANPVPDTDYTVAGFIGTDTLGGTVSMSYTETPDNTQHGFYPITISGGTASDNYSVKHENGTLTISIDVSLITAAITAANNTKGGIATYDTAASSVAYGTKFVTTAEMSALNTAIQTATDAKASCTTLAQVQAAAKALDDAVADFKAAIKTGTYTAPSGGGSTGG
ncbi:MAG: YDG domain-containing protein, partial [Angelakisella sp.]